MALTLDLPPDLEQILYQTAQQQGITAEALALQFLAKGIHADYPQDNTLSLAQSTALEACRNIRAIGRQMPPIDAIELTRQERDRLLERGIL